MNMIYIAQNFNFFNEQFFQILQFTFLSNLFFFLIKNENVNIPGAENCQI